VRIDAVFANAVQDPALRSDLVASIGLCFGSEYVAEGFTQYVAGVVPSSMREAAASVLAFDVFVHNPDRRADNPNLFVDRSGYLVFDHEQAFSFLLPLLAATEPPETSPALDIVDRHVFRRAFGRSDPDFTPFRNALAEDRTTPNTLAFEASTRGQLLYER